MGYDPSIMNDNPRYRRFLKEYAALKAKGVHPQFAEVMAKKRVGILK